MNRSRSPLAIEPQIEDLKQLCAALRQTSTLYEKLDILNQLHIVQDFVNQNQDLRTFLVGLNPECDYLIKSIIAIGQGPIVFNMQQAGEDKFELLHRLIKQLVDIDHFYQYLGGIIGYHLTVLSLIHHQEALSPIDFKHSRFIHPEGIQLDQETSETRAAIRCGLESLEKMAEIYPVGGAGDRLNLIDEHTGVALPAAVLPFNGCSLLEGLLRDIQAREYLYYKFYDKQILTPIAMMTSGEKNNHTHIMTICKRKNWFGRPSESFFFFVQPLVPVITHEGNWSLSAPLTLFLKPGGHGVIWKLAEETGVFDWVIGQGREYALIRQINNPLAGLDNTLLALMGLGIKDHKIFGFASCERLLKSAEGTNVLIETKTAEGFSYCLTNIEYTDFEQKGIGEEPAKLGSPYSIYPTNTNILFIHIPAIREALKKCPIPGQLINMKSKVPFIDPAGHHSPTQGGRLESTMQNIADYFTDSFPYQLKPVDFRHQLRTFMTYNERIKTISTTKKSYKPGESPVSTPEQAYYDLLMDNLCLLEQCGFKTPKLGTIEEQIEKGPECIFTYHPALGPIYPVIRQKIRQGRLMPRSELQLEIAEIDIENLTVDGSAIIEAVCPLGHYEESGRLRYGHESRCLLHNVMVRNKGINWNTKNHFWKHQIFHQESLYVLLHEGAEFEAQHVNFDGDFFFEVPAHHRLVITQDRQGTLHRELKSIHRPSWHWKYTFNADNQIKLIRESGSV